MWKYAPCVRNALGSPEGRKIDRAADQKGILALRRLYWGGPNPADALSYAAEAR